jgi:hypothetical protein
MTNDHYILHSDGSMTTVDLMTWAEWFENGENRRVAFDEMPDGSVVSTVFLGIDHNFSLEGPPILFETMILGGPHDQYQDRYATKDEAIAGHAKALRIAQGEEEEPA